MKKIKSKFSAVNEHSLKKVYEKCKPQMQERFGRVLTYDEFVATLASAHKRGKVGNS